MELSSFRLVRACQWDTSKFMLTTVQQSENEVEVCEDMFTHHELPLEKIHINFKCD